MKTRKAAVAAPMQSKDTKELRLPQLSDSRRKKSIGLQVSMMPENSFPTFDATYPIIWFGIPD